jgi:hypothetical protein
MLSKFSFTLGVFIAASILLSGCGGGSSSTTTMPSVSVTASATSVDATDAVKLSATVTNDVNNGGVTWTVSGGGTLSSTTTSAATYTAPAATVAAQSVTVTATSIADAAASNSVTLTIPALLDITTTDAQLTGTAGTEFSVQLAASGGIAPYKWTVDSSSTLPTGWSLSSSGLLTGPSAAPYWSGAFDLTVDVADSGTATPLTASAPHAVTVTPTESAAHNSYLSGTWVCSINGGLNVSGEVSGPRWAELTSFQADGKGNITSGVIDQNSRVLASAATGTLTGSYSIGSDNNGLLTANIVWGGGATGGGPTITNSYAIALNNLAGPTATRARLVEVDDVGEGVSPSSQHSAGICYPATTSDFTDSTLDGNFAYNMDGETSSGAPQAHVGRFTASSGQITNGVSDGFILPTTTDDSYTFTGSYTVPDPTTGRFTETLNLSNSQTATQDVGYIVNSTQIYRLATVVNGGLLTGSVNPQTKSSFTDASLSGTIVSYGSGRAYSNGSVSGYDSWVEQGSADGAGNFTINQIYGNTNGGFGSVSGAEPAAAVSFDQNNLGRATFTPRAGGLGYLYFTGNNNALELDLNTGNGYLETGYFNAQTQTTFTDAAVAGDYLFGEATVATPGLTSQGEFDLDSAGHVTGGLSTGGVGYFAFDQPQSLAYQWDPLATAYGGLLIGSGSEEDSCVVNTSTRIICIVNDSPQAANFILLQ